ncbi:MAG: hypothetical protein AAF908_09840 [Pseudomonadota bacterium]
MTAYFEPEGDDLRLTVIFTEPSAENPDPEPMRTSIRLVNGQVFSLVLGHEPEVTTGRKYSFRRDAQQVTIWAEDYPGFTLLGTS